MSGYPLPRRSVVIGAGIVGAVALAPFTAAFAFDPNVKEFKKPGGKNKIVFLYLGAQDCPSCRSYEASRGDYSREKIIGYANEGKFRYVEVKVFMFKSLTDPREWPREFHWLLETLKPGTPKFLLINNKEQKVRGFHFGWNARLALEMWEKMEKKWRII